MGQVAMSLMVMENDPSEIYPGLRYGQEGGVAWAKANCAFIVFPRHINTTR